MLTRLDVSLFSRVIMYVVWWTYFNIILDPKASPVMMRLAVPVFVSRTTAAHMAYQNGKDTHVT